MPSPQTLTDADFAPQSKALTDADFTPGGDDKPKPIGEQPASFGGVARTMGRQALNVAMAPGESLVTGAKKLATPGSRLSGASDMLKGVVKAAGLAFAPEGIGALVSVPAKTLGAAALGGVGSSIGGAGGRALARAGGGGEGAQELGETLGSGVGGAAGTVGGVKAIDALPSTERAGRNFDLAMQSAKDTPVDVSHFADPVLRARLLNKVAGDPMAPVLRKALGQIGPNTDPLTYEHARILASSAGRKAQQTAMGGTLTGEMGKRLGEAATGLDTATQEAANTAGVGDIHAKAMKEYRNAKTLQGGLKKAAIIAGPPILGALGYKAARALTE